MGEKAKYKRGAASAVLAYMTSHTGRPVNGDELGREIGAFSRRSLLGGAAYLARNYPGRMVRRGNGVYEWVPGADSELVRAVKSSAGKPDEATGLVVDMDMIVKVLAIKHGEYEGTRFTTILVRDDESGELYSLTPYDL